MIWISPTNGSEITSWLESIGCTGLPRASGLLSSIVVLGHPRTCPPIPISWCCSHAWHWSSGTTASLVGLFFLWVFSCVSCLFGLCFVTSSGGPWRFVRMKGKRIGITPTVGSERHRASGPPRPEADPTSFPQGSKWIDSDTSILSLMSARVYRQFEKLVCSEQEHRKTDCHCATLQRHYGAKIFKCTFPSCGLHRQGFATRRARTAHVEHHARPWKCSVPECEFAIIGFARRRDQDEHWRKKHRVISQKDLANPSRDTITSDDLEVLLFELTKAGDIDGLQKASFLLAENAWPARAALALAAKMGSLPMVETLTTFFGWHRYDEMDGFQAGIVRSGNADLFRWLLGKLCGEETPGSYCRLAGEAFSTDSPDMYAVWEEFLLDPTRRLAGASPYYHEGGEEPDPDGYFRPAETLIPQYNTRSVLFSSPVFCCVVLVAFCLVC